ncbi:MAG: hypothetical protein FD167_4904, partial [bacterium]
FAIVAGRTWYFPAKPQGRIAQLVEVVGATRLTEARLSGGFAYAPFTPLPKLKKKKHLDFSSDPNLNLASNNFDDPNNSTILSNQDSSSAETLETVDNKALGTASRGASDKNYLNNLLLSVDSYSSSYFSLFTQAVSTRSATAGETTSTPRSKIAETLEFQTLANNIMLEDINQPTAETAHAVGIIYIFQGDFNEAINYLEKALTKSPNNAEILSDLAAAYLARAEDEDQPQNIFQALSLIHEALVLDSQLVEAKFNKALLLEKLCLWETATDECTDYLKIEKDRKWANEAHNHIKNIEEKLKADSWPQQRTQLDIAAKQSDLSTVSSIVKANSYSAYAYALEELLPNWSDNIEGHSQDAETKLQIARLIGNALVPINKDCLIYDLVSSIDKNSNNEKWLNLAIKGYQNYKNGKNLIAILQYDKAALILDKAISEFSQLGDDGALVIALYQRIRCEPIKLNYGFAVKASKRLISIAKKNNY